VSVRWASLLARCATAASNSAAPTLPPETPLIAKPGDGDTLFGLADGAENVDHLIGHDESECEDGGDEDAEADDGENGENTAGACQASCRQAMHWCQKVMFPVAPVGALVIISYFLVRLGAIVPGVAQFRQRGLGGVFALQGH
jgi:hypothetical protein